MVRPISRHSDFVSELSVSQRLRKVARDAAVYALSMVRSVDSTGNWLRFPYYHHVFDDERSGFARQLAYMRRFGEFISFDDGVDLLATGQPIDGRYFCLSFDDGFKNCAANALPILVEHGAIGTAFFVPTRFIGTDIETDRELLLGFFTDESILLEFMNWRDCQDLLDAGMVIGSHSHSHANLARQNESTVAEELRRSKIILEERLGRPCRHFGCPFGNPGRDFLVGRDPELARQAGYASFATTARGAMRGGDSPFFICRDHLMANWPDYQLRYFFSR